jgi:hypothetical protein
VESANGVFTNVTLAPRFNLLYSSAQICPAASHHQNVNLNNSLVAFGWSCGILGWGSGTATSGEHTSCACYAQTGGSIAQESAT